MGTVSQFDKDDADILHHRHDHLAEVFGLRLFLIAEFQLIKLRDPFHQFGNAFAKELFHILVSGGGIFDHVMQQRSHYRFIVEFHLGQNTGHRYRVSDIGFTA
ncbi:hypothetical protein D3C86_1842670 [compost metagenome]